MTVGAPHRPVLRQRVDVMVSTAEVTLVGGTPDATTAAVAGVQDLERRWSRFRPDSEVSRLSAHAGRPVPVSHETLLLVQLARQGWRRMAGRYDPTLLAAVRRAGYTADFARLPAVPQRLTGPADHDPRTCGRITIDEHAGTVELPRDCGFDPGGIGKGLAADLVTAELASGGIPGGCVNIGGDLRVWGRGPQDDRWLVAAAAWQAEAYALAALLSGPAGAHADLRRWRVDGLVVDDRGRVHASRRLRRRR